VSVKVKIFHAELQRIAGGTNELLVEGATVGECLDDLVRRLPEAKPLMFDSSGRLHKRFYVFVNHEGMFKAESSRPVSDKDTLILVFLATAG
jgi:molybdopterin converting factor small subunit